MNCGFSPSEPRRRLPAPKPEVSCWDWLPCWQVVLVYARKAESRQRWESLPEELPDLQETVTIEGLNNICARAKTRNEEFFT